jgi:hypothetical protein
MPPLSPAHVRVEVPANPSSPDEISFVFHPFRQRSQALPSEAEVTHLPSELAPSDSHNEPSESIAVGAAAYLSSDGVPLEDMSAPLSERLPLEGLSIPYETSVSESAPSGPNNEPSESVDVGATSGLSSDHVPLENISALLSERLPLERPSGLCEPSASDTAPCEQVSLEIPSEIPDADFRGEISTWPQHQASEQVASRERGNSTEDASVLISSVCVSNTSTSLCGSSASNCVALPVSMSNDASTVADSIVQNAITFVLSSASMSISVANISRDCMDSMLDTSAANHCVTASTADSESRSSEISASVFGNSSAGGISTGLGRGRGRGRGRNGGQGDGGRGEITRAHIIFVN